MTVNRHGSDAEFKNSTIAHIAYEIILHCYDRALCTIIHINHCIFKQQYLLIIEPKAPKKLLLKKNAGTRKLSPDQQKLRAL